MLGVLLSRTNAAFPYLDSFTSVGAVITTYMVAKKILENWIYWLVIDGLTLYIYWSRELYLYAALFVDLSRARRARVLPLAPRLARAGRARSA